MDYARALVEHPKWRWDPGMGIRTLAPGVTDIVAWVNPDYVNAASPCGAWIRYRHERLRMPDGCTVDINHPATKGWLLHMLREAVEGHAFCDLESTEPDEWRVNADYLEMDGPWDFPTAPTEGEALAAALLAVWGQA